MLDKQGLSRTLERHLDVVPSCHPVVLPWEEVSRIYDPLYVFNNILILESDGIKNLSIKGLGKANVGVSVYKISKKLSKVVLDV